MGSENASKGIFSSLREKGIFSILREKQTDVIGRIRLAMNKNKYPLGHKGGRSEEELKSMFESWMVEHDKTYNSLEEKEKRFKIFKDDVTCIDEHNAIAILNQNCLLGLNQFSDLTKDEFKKYYLMDVEAMRKVMKDRNFQGNVGEFIAYGGSSYYRNLDQEASDQKA